MQSGNRKTRGQSGTSAKKKGHTSNKVNLTLKDCVLNSCGSGYRPVVAFAKTGTNPRGQQRGGNFSTSSSPIYPFIPLPSVSSPSYLPTLFISPPLKNVYYTVQLLKMYSCIFCFHTAGRDSSAGIATRYGLDGPVIESQWRRDFPRPPRPVLDPLRLL